MQDGALSLWTPRGILSHRLEPPASVPSTSYALAVAPNGLWLAAAPSTPLLLLYDLQHPRLVTAMHPKNQHPVLQLSFLADSRTLAVLSSDSRITFTDVESARQLFSLQLPSPAAAMCVERRGNYAAAVTSGGTVSLHDVAAVREAVPLLPAAADSLSDPCMLKRTAPAALRSLDLRALPPQPGAAAASTRAAAAHQRGRGAARGQSAGAASCSRSRSDSWGRGRPPRTGQRAPLDDRHRSGPQQRRSDGNIVRVRSHTRTSASALTSAMGTSQPATASSAERLMTPFQRRSREINVHSGECRLCLSPSTKSSKWSTNAVLRI